MRSTLVVLFAALLMSGNLGARSLEESYAKLCSDPIQAKSETCLILAKGLEAKQPRQVTAASPQSRKRWGVFVDQVGKDWYMVSNGSILPVRNRYFWTVPNKEFVAELFDEAGNSVSRHIYRWNEADQRISLIGPGGVQVGVYIAQPDGSIHTLEQGTARMVIRRLVDGSFQTAMEEKTGGIWRLSKEMVRYISTSPASVEREGQRLLVAESATRDGQRFKATESASGDEQVSDSIWGPLKRLAGTTWALRGNGGFNLLDKFTWVEGGTGIRYFGGMPGLPATEVVFRPGSKKGELAAVVTSMGSKKKVIFHLDQYGTLVSDWYKDWASMPSRLEFRLTADGRYESRSALGTNGNRPEFAPLHGQFRIFSEAETDQIAAETRQKVQIIDRQVKEQMAAEQRAAKAAKAARSAERAAMFGAVVQGVAQGFAEADTGGYAESQANLDATVANIQNAAAVERQQQAQAAPQSGALASRPVAELQPQPQRQDQPQPQSQSSYTTAAETAAPAAAKELRFVMSISLRNQPGDKVNPTCYSNIISRPGPLGWGTSGFLPRGSAEQAREIVYGMKSNFIARCRASGREITSDGSFNFQLNQVQSDEERLHGMRARYSEDVSVSL